MSRKLLEIFLHNPVHGQTDKWIDRLDEDITSLAQYKSSNSSVVQATGSYLDDLWQQLTWCTLLFWVAQFGRKLVLGTRDINGREETEVLTILSRWDVDTSRDRYHNPGVTICGHIMLVVNPATQANTGFITRLDVISPGDVHDQH